MVIEIRTLVSWMGEGRNSKGDKKKVTGVMEMSCILIKVVFT